MVTYFKLPTLVCFQKRVIKTLFFYNCKKGGSFAYLLYFMVEVMEHMMGYYSGLRL
jgi:hypothetical protein